MSDEIKNLLMRRALCQSSIRILEQAADDPRQAEAMQYYQGQLAEIEEKIVQAQKPEDDVVIGLKTASLAAKR